MAEHPSRKRERSSSSPSLPTSRNERPTPRSPPPIRPLPSQHVSPEALAFLEHYRDCSTSIIATYQKSLYEQYWMRENGAITDGVLHLAYAPDSPPKKAAPKHPDIVRAEYERISATIDWMVGERGSYGAALVVYGQPGCGKSRFLRIERARLFEDGRPCIVTTTERSTFDLYCDAGAFFDIPLKELEALDLLIPTIALVDAAEGVGVTDLQHAFVHDFIPNVVVVFATSPRVRRWQKLSSRLVPTLYWTIEGWPDNEIDALQKLVVLQPRSVWTNSPRVSLRQADRASHSTHLPPPIEVVRPLPSDVSPELRYRVAIRPPNEGEPLPPPSTFLPKSRITTTTCRPVFLPPTRSTPFPKPFISLDVLSGTPLARSRGLRVPNPARPNGALKTSSPVSRTSTVSSQASPKSTSSRACLMHPKRTCRLPRTSPSSRMR
ncbi:RHTO0S08e03708g1_1 [Rhodotorula toruloides]|uniref:RHTO0S08e03708g1_1 n=1 Tax=Rhodotorula toruloides TaxID=5286 RepID=A0A061B6X8_RHOTO|nr:RHTO0S08e03708g1_1 [Rhodotorula toruloides]